MLWNEKPSSFLFLLKACLKNHERNDPRSLLLPYHAAGREPSPTDGYCSYLLVQTIEISTNEQWPHSKLTFSLSMAHKHLRNHVHQTPTSLLYLHVEDRGCGSGSIRGSECLITASQPIILTRDIVYILSNVVIISVNREGRREGTLNHGSTFIWVEEGGKHTPAEYWQTTQRSLLGTSPSLTLWGYATVQILTFIFKYSVPPLPSITCVIFRRPIVPKNITSIMEKSPKSVQCPFHLDLTDTSISVKREALPPFKDNPGPHPSVCVWVWATQSSLLSFPFLLWDI